MIYLVNTYAYIINLSMNNHTHLYVHHNSELAISAWHPHPLQVAHLSRPRGRHGPPNPLSSAWFQLEFEAGATKSSHM